MTEQKFLEGITHESKTQKMSGMWRVVQHNT